MLTFGEVYKEKYLAELHRWINSEGSELFSERWQTDSSIQAVASWANKKLSSSKNYTLFCLSNGKLVGLASLSPIDSSHGNVNLTILVSPEHRGRGYGRILLVKLLEKGFHEKGLHRVGLTVKGYNEPAICLYQKLGFIEEGRQREAVLKDGERYDRVIMGILKKEWLSH